MNLIFLGTGTSQGIPVIGCKCEVCQSTDPHDNRTRSSAWIQTNSGIKLLIDIGADFRQQMLLNNLDDVDAVLLTHEHNDHVAGLDDIRSINFLHKKNIPVYGMPRVIQSIRNRYPYIFSEHKYPGTPQIELHEIKSNHFSIGDTVIELIHVMHGNLPILGFKIDRLAYITDASHIAPNEKKKLKDLDILVINALRKKKHHSHFTLSEALNCITELSPKQSYLTHLSHLMGLSKDLDLEIPHDVSIAYDGLSINL